MPGLERDRLQRRLGLNRESPERRDFRTSQPLYVALMSRRADGGFSRNTETLINRLYDVMADLVQTGTPGSCELQVNTVDR